MSFSFKQHILIPLCIAVGIVLSANVYAGNVKIAEKPLVNSGTSDVLPNIMFVLDNSGSMGYNYTPDWVDDNSPPVWLFNNGAYNTQFYNPSITYTAAVKYDGVSMGNQASPWTAVKNDVTETGAAKGGTVSLVGNADYYAYIPGEYCTTPALTTCIASATATATYKYAAPIRWCNNSTAAITFAQPATADVCRSIREGTYTNLRAPSATATITFSGSNSTSISSIKVSGKEILSATTSASTNSGTVATNVANAINACTKAVTGNCSTIGYSASRSGSIVTIVSAWGDVDVPISATVTKSGSMTATVAAFATRTPGKMAYVDIVSTNNSYPLPGQTTKATDRTDCSSTCTYEQEMTNYANWYTYYRIRMQAMKTAATIAFKGIDNRYRVGFITISNQSNNYLPIAKFESGSAGQKSNWYKKLYATTPSGGTPLRSALSIVGRIYAGKKPVGNADPVEYSCQQNFTLLTTDGYWNTDAATDVKDIKGNAVGNLDKTSPRPLYEGPTATSGSLADVAKYYYDTDIRNKADFDNCSNGTVGSDVCGSENDHPKQNMVTLTLGLGIDGTLLYSDDYKEQTSGNYADIKSGSANWSNPMPTENGTRIDDLWHAAVNAGGTYYSAKNPKLLRDSLIKGLSEIKSVYGAGSAAAASSLAPTAGDNFQYVASYSTVKWTGNLEARTVDVDTLKTSQKATWCAENVASGTCTSPAVLKAVTSGSTQTFYCETPSSDTDTCGDLGGQLGIGGTSNACYVEVPTICTGTMSSLVSQTSDSRKIYVNSGGTLTNFTAGALSSSAQTAFVNGYNALSQYSDYSATQQSNANKVANLVSYLRGQTQYDNRTSNPDPEKKLFRPREAVLGDITQSKPAYLKKSTSLYVDPGYTAFKDATASRQGTVFVGANDGMLHAFNADTGIEMWAYIPTPVIKNLPKLADRDYAIKHANYVNGNPALADICISGCDTASAIWKTILIGGLNGGGRGYYALDVTSPTSPVLLWEFTADQDSSVGYSFGEPVVTKLSSGVNAGKWVVLLTSGYNNGTLDSDGVTSNSPTGNGQGYLYTLNAYNGVLIKKIGTGAGTSSSPSGLAKITAYVDDTFRNNFAKYVYGGDLEGGLWRFNLDDGVAVKIATLRDGGGVPQSITTMPELGLINKKRVLFVGTGKYLEETDLTSTQVQTVYAIKDDNISAEITSLRSGGLVTQTLSSTGDFRTASSNSVDFGTGYGWLVDFPAGERVNVDPLLLNGVLLMPTTVPNSTSCLGGGYGWFNYFNYKTGGSPGLAGGIVSEKLNTPAVGFNILYDKNGKPVVSVVESNDPTPHHLKNKDVAANSSASRDTIFELFDDGTYGRRSIWRELVK
ncbi:pilus assembly protein [Methylotenera sp. N17]|uniref:pilus assembly protein n=1 Tax=Methylotenera sp. N17 TaxID=1502761 RepID=UPI00068BD859|nr:PilC/PilY family type IV pilus protein [Methylotenera sp. N17]